jgi:hypothetical protein
MIPLVITENALQTFATRDVDPSWFLSPQNVASIEPLEVIQNEFGIYVVSPQCGDKSRILVIQRTEAGLFAGVPSHERRSVFDRCARLALRAFGNPVTLNPWWMPYHAENFVSVFAYTEGHGRERIVADVHPCGSQNVFICAFSSTQEIQNLNSFVSDEAEYIRSLDGFSKALKVRRTKSVKSASHIDLDDVVPGDFSKSLRYSEWYPKHLSKRQLEFVEQPIEGPIRLRGAAGTGKTLAMIIKALKTAYSAMDEGKRCKILFATHSWAGAELVDRVMQRIDERNILQTHNETVRIDIAPLLTLAEKRDYKRIGRSPLGIDSADGKRRTLKEISSIVDDFLLGDWIAFAGGCRPEFKERIEASRDSQARRRFCWDLLIEFGCVLAAEGILTHAGDKQKYLKIRRLRWMMELSNQSELSVVFALWTSFLRVLKEKSLIATDQIVSDFLNDLSTFYWEAAREQEGYDYIFVDEMHLFNSQERLVFHNLLAKADEPPMVIMAMDPKQSPRETFGQVHEMDKDDSAQENIYARARLPNPTKIDFVEVYRYTPEIERLISVLNEAAPALDLQEDWDIPPGHSQMHSGPIPTYRIFKDKLETYKGFIAVAKRAAAEASKLKGKVAVLCMDREKFDIYRRAAVAQYANDIFVIASRDDTEKLRYAGKKIVLSAPEYVAGLQFDTVIIVDANKNMVPEGKYNGYLLRRFLSELYLGISRAERKLILIASKDEGGLTDLLTRAMQAGLLVASSE